MARDTITCIFRWWTSRVGLIVKHPGHVRGPLLSSSRYCVTILSWAFHSSGKLVIASQDWHDAIKQFSIPLPSDNMGPQPCTVVIFDTPDNNGVTWSHHVFRILFSLHHKNIPYSIENLEYPDINEHFDATSLAPKEDPVEPYEIPVLLVKTLPDNIQYTMGAINIINVLEDIQPSAPLLHGSSRSVEFRSRFGPAFAPILQAVAGHVPKILSERSAETFAQKRKNRWGETVEQWNAKHPLTEGLIIAKPRIQDLGDWLEMTVGPFIHGSEPSYADFTIVSFLCFVKAVGFADAFRNLLAFHPAILRLYNAVKATQEKNERCCAIFEDGEEASQAA